MISKGSCDWSNDAKKKFGITGINYSLKYIQIESSYFKYKKIFHNLLFLGSNKCRLGKQKRNLKKKTFKILKNSSVLISL